MHCLNLLDSCRLRITCELLSDHDACLADEAAQLSSALVQQGPVGAGRKALLTWLICAADSSKQVATTRAKAIKALGLVAEQDPRLLVLPILQAGVNRALQVG